MTSYKGNLEKGSKVDISEPWYLSDGKYVAVENYIALDKEQEYTIFLGEKIKTHILLVVWVMVNLVEV